MALWEKLSARALVYVRRHWRSVLSLRHRLRPSEEAVHLALAGVVGIVGGSVHLVYHWLGKLIQTMAYLHHGTILEVARGVEPAHRLAVTGAGGLVAGLVLFQGLRLASKGGQSNLLEVVVAGDGRMPFRPSFIKALSSALSINTGASIGREGLIIQLVAVISSKLGQWVKWPPYRLRLLVACGAAAGMAAAFDAPVAGAVFAAQIVLGNFSMRLFAPLVFASVIAAMMSRRFFHIEQWYVVPVVSFENLGQLPWFLLLGVLAGGAGATFLKLLNRAQKWFAKMPLPGYARIALAGMAVGAMAMLFPEVMGNGYEATSEMLDEQVSPERMAALFVAKMLATILCIGAGTVGGVFTPTLFLGAALGCLTGSALHLAGWQSGMPIAVFGLVGMGSILAATTHSPLLAIIMIFELSLNYSIMPPLMLACVVATLVSRSQHPESIYSESLRQKDLLAARDDVKLGAALEMTVGDLMRERVAPLRETASFDTVASRFLTSTYHFLPVVNADQRLIGLIALQDIKEYLGSNLELGSVIAYDLMRPPPPCLTPNQRFSDVLPVLLSSELRNVPVVNDRAEFKLIGALSRADALSMYSELISSKRPPK